MLLKLKVIMIITIVLLTQKASAWNEHGDPNGDLSLSSTNAVTVNKENIYSTIRFNKYDHGFILELNHPNLNCLNPCFVGLKFDEDKIIKYKASVFHYSSGVMLIINSDGGIERKISGTKKLRVIIPDGENKLYYSFAVNRFNIDNFFNRTPKHESNMPESGRIGEWVLQIWQTKESLYTLSIKSIEKIKLNYADDNYNNTEKAVFEINEKPTGLREVKLNLGRAIIKNDFLCSSMCLLNIKFDNGKYHQYLASYSRPHYTARISGYSLTGVGEDSELTIQSNGVIEKQIAKASKMTILIDYYQSAYTGEKESHEYTFAVDRFDINKKLKDLSRLNSSK